MARIRSIVVYDSILYGRGHNIRRWAKAVERRYTSNAILFAPVNKRAWKGPHRNPPGALKRSISGEVTRSGPRHLTTRISVNVSYATYVIRGTGPWIDAGGKPMKIPDAWAGHGFFYRKAVRGQSANRFLDTAHTVTAARHPSLRNGLSKPRIGMGRR